MSEYEVKTEYDSEFFNSREEAEVAFDNKTSSCWYVLLIKHTPGECDEILESSF